MAKKPKDVSDTEENVEQVKSKLPPKPALIGGALAVLLVLGGGGYYFFTKKPAEQAVKVDTKKVGSIDLPDMTINLAGSSGQERQQFLKLKLSLEVSDPKMLPEITPMLPRV
jgi:flagellar protein FliL